MLPRTDPERIGIYRVGHLGDTVVAMPAFWTVRQRFPDARITLITVRHREDTRVQVFDVIPPGTVYDDLLAFPRRVSGGGLLSNLSRMWAIRKRRIETLVYLTARRTPTQMRRDRLFFRLAGVRSFVGMVSEVTIDRPQRPDGPLPTIQSEADVLLDHLQKDGLILPEGVTPRMDLGLSLAEREQAAAWLNMAGFGPESRLVCVAPCSKMPSKTWPEERFVEVCRELDRRYELRFVTLGGHSETGICELVARSVRRGISAAGKLSIRESAAVACLSSMYLGVDSGPMHLAASCGVPCVAVFAAVDWPGRWHPYGPGHHVHRRYVPCEGCRLDVCDKQNLCLTMIPASDVIASCCTVLDRQGNSGHPE